MEIKLIIILLRFRRRTRCETAEKQGNAEMVYPIVFSRHEIPALISRKKGNTRRLIDSRVDHSRNNWAMYSTQILPEVWNKLISLIIFHLYFELVLIEESWTAVVLGSCNQCSILACSFAAFKRPLFQCFLYWLLLSSSFSSNFLLSPSLYVPKMGNACYTCYSYCISCSHTILHHAKHQGY